MAGTRERQSYILVCERCAIDLEITIGSAARTTCMNNVDTRFPTRFVAAARLLGIRRAALAGALSTSATPKRIFFDQKIPELVFARNPAECQ